VGRLTFHATDVDAFWTHLKERGFIPEIPRDASWGERYSTYSIRMATNCRLLSRCNELAKECIQTKCVWQSTVDQPRLSGLCLDHGLAVQSVYFHIADIHVS
jgi:hypothetical protein